MFNFLKKLFIPTKPNNGLHFAVIKLDLRWDKRVSLRYNAGDDPINNPLPVIDPKFAVDGNGGVDRMSMYTELDERNPNYKLHTFCIGGTPEFVQRSCVKVLKSHESELGESCKTELDDLIKYIAKQ